MATTEAYFSIDVNTGAKTVECKVVGVFTPEKVEEFLTDYKQKTSTINPSEYVFIGDCTDITVLGQDMAPIMQNCLALYNQSGYGKIQIETGNSVILQNQFKRLARNAGIKEEIFEVISK
ncbi:hypothetical protein [Bacillus sp. 1P06AnD]|uniref:hypothetical protein n=1 Tax=Bacillus sp. 1P06AnD TaxID=3132208 RepID=UPI00399EFF65